MGSNLDIANRLFSIQSDADFEALANEVRAHQIEKNSVYKSFLERTKRLDVVENTFLPIELFKSHRVSCEPTEDLIFKSSGTTDTGRSTHFVFDQKLSAEASIRHFENLYGQLKDWAILALLPSYIENGESSLVYMVETFMKHASHVSDFVLHEPKKLKSILHQLAEVKQKTLLIGVSYALLDFAENSSIDSPELIVMETGGMKGRRKELTREELHTEIKKGFPTSAIHSEYGMTELLSQGYQMDGEFFTPPKWMKVFTTDVSDPFEIQPTNKRGLLAFIDLANYHSCSFIQTRDIGFVLPDGRFKVEGRLDHSDLRGCNLLYT